MGHQILYKSCTFTTSAPCSFIFPLPPLSFTHMYCVLLLLTWIPLVSCLKPPPPQVFLAPAPCSHHRQVCHLQTSGSIHGPSVNQSIITATKVGWYRSPICEHPNTAPLVLHTCWLYYMVPQLLHRKPSSALTKPTETQSNSIWPSLNLALTAPHWSERLAVASIRWLFPWASL